jgi:hypothetical protein
VTTRESEKEETRTEEPTASGLPTTRSEASSTVVFKGKTFNDARNTAMRASAGADIMGRNVE